MYIRGWLAVQQVNKQVNRRMKTSKLEQNRVAEFCGHIKLQAECFYEKTVKTNVVETIQKSNGAVNKRDIQRSSYYYDVNYLNQKDNTYLSINHHKIAQTGRINKQV